MAVVSVEAPLEKLFQQIDALKHCKDTTPIDTSIDALKHYDFKILGFDNIFVERVSQSPQEQWVRYQFTEKIGYEDEVAYSVPEFYFHPRRPDFDENILECGIERLYGPGNAIVWTRLRVAAARRQMSALNSAVAGKFGDLQGHGDGDDDSVIYRMRWVVRRDGADGCLVAWMPYHPETGELVPYWADCYGGVFHMRPHGEGGTSIVGLEPFPAMPHWAESFAAPRCMELRQGFWMKELESEKICENASRDLLWAAADYIIIGLRKCSKGGPLLPVRKEEGLDWEQWASFGTGSGCTGRRTGCTVAEYLTEFSSRLGVTDLILHNNHFGWHLVPYQASVLRSEWESAWPQLEEPFREMRSAFRRARGGRVAPELLLDTEPRYFTPPLGEAASDAAALATADERAASGSSRRSSQTGASAIRATFVHFGAKAPMPRSGSWHAMPTHLEESAGPGLSAPTHLEESARPGLAAPMHLEESADGVQLRLRL